MTAVAVLSAFASSLFICHANITVSSSLNTRSYCANYKCVHATYGYEAAIRGPRAKARDDF